MKTINIKYTINEDGEIKSNISCDADVSLKDVLICLSCDQKFFNEVSIRMLKDFDPKDSAEVEQGLRKIKLSEALQDYHNIKTILDA